MAANLSRTSPDNAAVSHSAASTHSTTPNTTGDTQRAAPPVRTPDLCVIGAGSGGLSVAAAAAALGVSVVLIEKHKMGGDCLNSGCVPSKALISAARRAHDIRTSAKFGITAAEPAVNFAAVHAHIHGVIAAIAPNDSVERFTALGVDVIQEAAHFIDANTVASGDALIRARRFIVATGSSPAVPAIPGLQSVPYLTNESIFDLDQPMGHLIVIGGGAIGMELAQAYRRLGSRVTVLEAATALAKEDPELTSLALRALRIEGLDIREGVKVLEIGQRAGAIEVRINDGTTTAAISGTHLLIATGRKPNIDGLGLDKAGIKADAKGIKVNRGLKSSNRRVYAIGDVVGGQQFTHVANDHAGIVIRRALFRLPAKVAIEPAPRVTFTDPELAQVGLTEAEARAMHGKITVYRWPYHDNDRAQAERTAQGLVKVVCSAKGKIIGAGIVGAQAGELIQTWSLAISQGLSISAMTQWIAPYPTLGESSRRAAFTSLALKARHPATRKLLAILRKFG